MQGVSAARWSPLPSPHQTRPPRQLCLPLKDGEEGRGGSTKKTIGVGVLLSGGRAAIVNLSQTERNHVMYEDWLRPNKIYTSVTRFVKCYPVEGAYHKK